MIKNVFVMGSGTMGNGIAQVSAEAGYDVTMMDIKEEFTARGMAAIEKSLDRKIKRGDITETDKSTILSRIKTTTRLEDAASADIVIEAIPEVLNLKVDAFNKLDGICPAHTILASNTSALPIGSMAAATGRKEKVIGLHFMNPVPVMKGVEVIVGDATSEETIKAGKEFVASLGKESCEARDRAGFIVSRLVDALMNEAFYCIMDGNKPEEVDKAMKLCANFPMGPLELCDFSGADVVLHGLETMEQEFGDRLSPAPILKKMVEDGKLGRKTGQGFYEYPPRGL